MFERRKIVRELQSIAAQLQESPSNRVGPEVVHAFDSVLDQYAKCMRECRYDARQAVVRMVTGVAVFAEANGSNRNLKVSDPQLYGSFKNLYNFCTLTYLKYPEHFGGAYCVPEEGAPQPFSETEN